MKHSIKALGWAINVLWVLMILFAATTIYSGVNFLQGPELRCVKSYVEGEAIIRQFSISVNNTGFYNIHDLNITTYAEDPAGEVISKPSTSLVPFIIKGSTSNVTHNLILNFSDIVSRRLHHLIFNDTVLNQFWSVSAKIAGVMPISIRMNNTIDWNAPLSHFSVSEPSFETDVAMVTLTFENHSPHTVTTSMRVELYNGEDALLGSTLLSVYAPPGYYHREVTLFVDPSKVTDSGFVRVYFLDFDYEECFPYG